MLLFQALLFALHVEAQNRTFVNSTSISNTTSSPTPSTSTIPSYPLTTDGTCGNQAGLMCLTNGTSPCCSSSGYCGNDDDYCSTESGCQSDYGKCSPNSATIGFPECSWSLDVGDSPRCDGRCGNGYNGATCASGVSADAFAIYGVYDYGECCSSSGFCGSTENHCSLAKQCQSGCDNNTAPSSATSAAPAATSSSASFGGRAAESWSGGVLALAASLIGISFGAL